MNTISQYARRISPKIANVINEHNRDGQRPANHCVKESTRPREAAEKLRGNWSYLGRGNGSSHSGRSFVNQDGEPEFIGTVIDITELKRVAEIKAALAHERELFLEQRATELAKANEALRGCLDALASVPELDEFLGQMMAAITRQLGAISSTLRVRNFEQNTMPLELVFQDGRVMTPNEARYPECWQTVSLEQFDPSLLFHSGFTRTKDEQRLATFLNPPTAIIRVLDPHSPMPDDQRSYLRGLNATTCVGLV